MFASAGGRTLHSGTSTSTWGCWDSSPRSDLGSPQVWTRKKDTYRGSSPRGSSCYHRVSRPQSGESHHTSVVARYAESSSRLPGLHFILIFSFLEQFKTFLFGFHQSCFFMARTIIGTMTEQSPCTHIFYQPFHLSLIDHLHPDHLTAAECNSNPEMHRINTSGCRHDAVSSIFKR